MVVGKHQNHRDHDTALTNLLETARKSNIHLNFDKLHYKKTGVDFFGETYTTDGCKPAQSKVSAISEMPPPTYKKQVQSFIGMVNYISKFLARLLELTEPIRDCQKIKCPSTGDQNIKQHLSKSTKRLLEPPYWPITIPRNEQHFKQMQVSKGSEHACCKTRNQSTL